jgi:hypothetical protein
MRRFQMYSFLVVISFELKRFVILGKVRFQNGEGRLLELAQCHSMQLGKLTCQYRRRS